MLRLGTAVGRFFPSFLLQNTLSFCRDCHFRLQLKDMPSSCYLVSDLNCGRFVAQFPKAQQGSDLLMDMQVCREKGLI